MKEQPLVSVLMTAYNREKFIGEAIESVLVSTYTNFELIIVDDGSKDNTVAIAKRYAASDSRVKVFLNEKNLGDYPNRNRAASLATGKYLKYVDSDDYIYPHGLEILISMMEKFPEAGWGLCSLWPDNEKPFPLCLSPQEAYQYHYFGPGLFHKAPGSSIFLREVFNAEGGFTAQRMSGDNEMWHRMALRYPVVLMPDGVIWNRLNLGHESELTHFRKYAMQYEQIKWDYLKNPLNPLTQNQKRQLHKREIAKTIRGGFFRLSRFKIKEAFSYFMTAYKNF